MRILCGLTVLTLAGCLGSEPVACESSVDRCDVLEDWPLAAASFTVEETTTLTMDFRETGAERPRTLRLVCETDGALDSCIKSWVMPDLPRLPHAEARLLGIDPPAQSMRGKFRIDEVVLLTDQQSYRVSGSVDQLRFDTDDEILVFAAGSFDLIAREVEP
jgi:hypothetical protein